MKFSWKRKKILITGHTGFVGSWLTFLLNKKKIENYGISLKQNKSKLFTLLSTKNNDFYFDINDFNKLDKIIKKTKPNIIIHLAAKSLVLDSYKNPIDTYKTNIIGTLNILRVVKKYSFIKSLILFTTDKVYENDDLGINFHENCSLNGDDPYSGSKAASEIVINSFVKSYLRKKNIVILRAGNIIGGGDYTKSRLIPDIIQSYINNSFLKVRNPNSIRPWQHILDIINIILKTVEKTYYNKNYFEKFNLGPKKSNIKVKKIIQAFHKNFKLKKLVVKNNKYEKKNLRLDSTKIFKKLRLKNKLSNKKTIERTIKWYTDFHILKKNPNYLCEEDINYYNKL